MFERLTEVKGTTALTLVFTLGNGHDGESVPEDLEKKNRKNKEVKLSIWGYLVNLSRKGRRNWFKVKLSRLSMKAGTCPDRVDYWGGGGVCAKQNPPNKWVFYAEKLHTFRHRKC